MHVALSAVAAALPALFLLWYFYARDVYPEPRRVVQAARDELGSPRALDGQDVHGLGHPIGTRRVEIPGRRPARFDQSAVV